MNIPSHPAPSPMQGNTAAEVPIPLNVLVDNFRKLRDQKKALEDKHKLELAPYNNLMEQINARLFAALTSAGLDSIKTDGGTAYKTTTVTYSIEDPEAYRQWVEANGASDAYENRPSKSFLDNLAAEKGFLPPGIKINSYTKINIRK